MTKRPTQVAWFLVLLRRAAKPLLCSVAGLWTGMLLAGTVPDTLTNGLELIPEKSSLWSESFLWDKDITVL